MYRDAAHDDRVEIRNRAEPTTLSAIMFFDGQHRVEARLEPGIEGGRLEHWRDRPLGERSFKTGLKHRGQTYRLFNFRQTRKDWSIIVSWNRAAVDEQEMFKFSSGSPLPERAPLPIEPMRLTYHTTGQVNFHGWVDSDPSFFDPLHALRSPQLFIAVSIPQAGRLLLADKADLLAFEMDDAFGDDRFTIGLVMAPQNCESPPNTLFRVEIDIVSILAVSLPTPVIPAGLEAHFLHMAPGGPNDRLEQTPDEAMLAYHQVRVGNDSLYIYPPDGDGVYTLFAPHFMSRAPTPIIKFVDPNYRVEMATDRKNRQMKSAFRIWKGNQRITTGDLRSEIVEVFLNARLDDPIR